MFICCGVYTYMFVTWHSSSDRRYIQFPFHDAMNDCGVHNQSSITVNNIMISVIQFFWLLVLTWMLCLVHGWHVQLLSSIGRSLSVVQFVLTAVLFRGEYISWVMRCSKVGGVCSLIGPVVEVSFERMFYAVEYGFCTSANKYFFSLSLLRIAI
jgi:hypothetical protein